MAKTYAPKTENKQINTQKHNVQIGDIDMYYEEYGQGDDEHKRPLLLLHGFGGCSQNWHPFTARLAEQHHLIVVDLRGHGYTNNPANTFTHRDAAVDIFLLLEKLGVKQFSAMGMSTGGMILMHMAAMQPGRIRSMVLISVTTHFPEQARAIMRRASFDTMPTEVTEMYRECAKRGDEQIAGLIKQFNAFSDNHEDMNFTEETLSGIKTPTLLVHGDRDNFFPVEIALTLCRHMPGAALWIIAEGDHVPIFDARVPFTETALRFLEESGTGNEAS